MVSPPHGARPGDVLVLGERRDRPGEPVTLPPAALLRHVMALGSSGSGKTVFCKVLAEEAAMHGVPVIAIDPQGDLASLALEPPPPIDATDLIEGEEPLSGGPRARSERGPRAPTVSFHDRVDVVVFTPASRRGIPLSADPVHGEVGGGGELSEAGLLRATSRTAGRIVSLLGYDLDGDDGAGLVAVFDACLGQMAAEGRPAASLRDVTERLERLRPAELERLGRYLSERKIRAACQRAARLDVGARRLLFHDGVPIDIDILLGRGAGAPPPGKTRVSVIYLNTLESQEDKDFVVATLADRLVAWMLRHPSPTLQALFYIDEVAPYMPPVRKPACKEDLQILFKQARKFGVGCVVATQNPGDVDYKAMGQFGTWALGRLATRQDLKKVEPAVRSLMPGAEALLGEVPSLRPGELVLLSPDHFDEPCPLQTRWLHSEHRTLDEEAIAGLAAPWRAAFSAVDRGGGAAHGAGAAHRGGLDEERRAEQAAHRGVRAGRGAPQGGSELGDDAALDVGAAARRWPAHEDDAALDVGAAARRRPAHEDDAALDVGAAARRWPAHEDDAAVDVGAAARRWPAHEDDAAVDVRAAARQWPALEDDGGDEAALDDAALDEDVSLDDDAALEDDVSLEEDGALEDDLALEEDVALEEDGALEGDLAVEHGAVEDDALEDDALDEDLALEEDAGLEDGVGFGARAALDDDAREEAAFGRGAGLDDGQPLHGGRAIDRGDRVGPGVAGRRGAAGPEDAAGGAGRGGPARGGASGEDGTQELGIEDVLDLDSADWSRGGAPGAARGAESRPHGSRRVAPGPSMPPGMTRMARAMSVPVVDLDDESTSEPAAGPGAVAGAEGKQGARGRGAAGRAAQPAQERAGREAGGRAAGLRGGVRAAGAEDHAARPSAATRGEAGRAAPVRGAGARSAEESVGGRAGRAGPGRAAAGRGGARPGEDSVGGRSAAGRAGVGRAAVRGGARPGEASVGGRADRAGAGRAAAARGGARSAEESVGGRADRAGVGRAAVRGGARSAEEPVGGRAGAGRAAAVRGGARPERAEDIAEARSAAVRGRRGAAGGAGRSAADAAGRAAAVRGAAGQSIEESRAGRALPRAARAAEESRAARAGGAAENAGDRFLAALAGRLSMTSAEVAERAGVTERTARARLKALVASGQVGEFRVERTPRFWNRQSGARPDLGLKAHVLTVEPAVDRDAAEEIGRGMVRGKLLGVIGPDETFLRAELIHRLLYRVAFQEKVKRPLLGRLIGPSHEERLGSLYLHPRTLDVLLFSAEGGIRFATRLPEHASAVADLDGAAAFVDARPSDLAFDDEEWLARAQPALARKRVSELFGARAGAVTPLFVPLWRFLLRRGGGESYRVETVDALVGRPVDWPEGQPDAAI